MNLYKVFTFILCMFGIGFVAIWTFNHTPYPFLGILISFIIPVSIINFLENISND